MCWNFKQKIKKQKFFVNKTIKIIMLNFLKLMNLLEDTFLKKTNATFFFVHIKDQLGICIILI
jgi:hypothetical protein